MMISIRFEQAVYGSFPFWDKGYSILARSPGCRDEWLTDLRSVCQKYGEQPSGAAEAGGLFALRLPSGPWTIVQPSAQGNDDRGRPGALAFHAIFLSPREYRRADWSPFRFTDLLRSHWSADVRELPSGVTKLQRAAEPGPDPDPRVAWIVAAISAGRRVALEAERPIDKLAHETWCRLPTRVRSRASLATWAFGNGNTFDLVAMPRLAGAELDASYIVTSLADTFEATPAWTSHTASRRWPIPARLMSLFGRTP